MRTLFICTSFLFPLLSFATPSSSSDSVQKRCEIQGHRGYRGLFPENTLPAFLAAIEGEADGLELDLLLTSDGHFVIYHDYHIDPQLVVYLDKQPVPLPGPLIYSLTLAKVKEFDCGVKTNPAFPEQQALLGTQIPTLQELFTSIKNSSHPQAQKIHLNLEIKRETLIPEYTAPPSVLVDKLLSLVAANGFTERIYYSSFDPEVLFELRKKDPHARIALLQENTLENMIETASALQAEILSPESILLHNEEQVRMLQKRGFKVITWTLNDPEEWKKFIKMGVDGIITDYPSQLRKNF